MRLDFALNHMTVARKSFAELLDIAATLGCVGVELRNDLTGPLFDGRPPSEAAAMARDKGLRILTLAEVTRFNDWTNETADQTAQLIKTAVAIGAEAISLIPRNDNGGMNEGERQANLRLALREALPMLRDTGLRGLVEPLGFESCAVRSKSEVAQVIEALDAEDTVALIHDTFHHHLASDSALSPRHTALVHLSGVTDPTIATSQMLDPHRGLVTAVDRLGNINQIKDLTDAGYHGPLSFEVFDPDFHAIDDPIPAIRASMDFIRTSVRADAA